MEEWRERLDNNYVVGSVFMDLLKACDCIPHDLLIAKFDAHGFNRTLARYIYSYLEKRKQCVRINNATISLKHILPGVLQMSVLGSILLSLLFNVFFFCILIVSAHNFADDNSLSSFAGTVEELIELLQTECNVVIELFIENKMLVNRDKFPAILLDKQISDYTGTKLTAGSEEIQIVSSVDVSGITVDDKLNLHIDRICKTVPNQLNALIRLKMFLGFKERKL